MDNKEDYETLSLNDNYDTEKMSILEKYGENLTTKTYVTNPAIARDNEIEKTILTINTR